MLAMRCHRLRHVYRWFCNSPPAKPLPTCSPFIISIPSRTRIVCFFAPICCLQNRCRHVHCSFLRSCSDSSVILYLVLRQRQPFRVLASIVQKFPIVNVSINVTLNVSVTSPSPITL